MNELQNTNAITMLDGRQHFNLQLRAGKVCRLHTAHHALGAVVELEAVEVCLCVHLSCEVPVRKHDGYICPCQVRRSSRHGNRELGVVRGR